MSDTGQSGSNSEPATGDRTYQDTWWVNGVMLVLGIGDEIYINDRSRVIRLVERDPRDGDPVVELTFVGYGTEYTAFVPTIAEEWDRSPWLRTEAGTEVKIDALRVAGPDPVVVGDLTGRDYLRERLDPPAPMQPPRDQIPGDRDGESVGMCPDCGATAVVEDGERVACTGCPRWCWLDEWDAYYE